MTEIEEIKEGLESIKSFSEILIAKPKVHCIVNDVAIAITANALLAAGAQPSMTIDPFEVRAFTESADTLSINLGTLTNERRNVIRTSAKCANTINIPWVLDTTMIDRSSLRLDFCEELLEHVPTVIRGNEVEIEALTQRVGRSRTDFCKAFNTILVTTGETDWVDSQKKSCELKKLGHAWMSQVTGMGCMLSALIAAMLTAHDDSFSAALNTLVIYSIIGERAAQESKGPGSFLVNFIDRLSA